MWHAHDGMGWWMVFSGGLWVLLLILIVFAVIAFTRSTGDRPGRSEQERGDSALAITRERYARGEISRDEFEQLRRDLSQEDSQGSTPNPA